MPTFEVDIGGKGFEVDAPDMASASAALSQHLGGQAAAPAPPPAPSLGLGGTLLDVAKSAGAGLAEGVTGLVGLPGALAGLGTQASDYLFGTNAAPRGQAIQEAIGPGAVQRGVEKLTGPFYQSQTGIGGATRTAASFLPALVGGPETLALKLATRVAAPALLSEAGGQLAAGTQFETPARIGGALVGGFGGAAAGRAAASRAASAAIPTAQDIRASGSALYQHPIVAEVEFVPASVSKLSDNIAANLNKAGYRAHSQETGGAVFRTVEELKNPAGPTATVADLRSVQQALGNLGTELNAQGRPTAAATAARTASRQITDFMDNVRPADVLAGDARQASQILRWANQDWAAQAKANELGVKLSIAERLAAKNDSTIDRAIRDKVASILNNPAARAGYSADEIAQMERLVRGTAIGKTARMIAKAAPTFSPLSLTLHGMTALGTAGASLPYQIAGGVAGAGLRGLTQASTQRQARLLDEMIRRRSALAQTRPPAARPPPLLRGIGATAVPAVGQGQRR